MSIYQYKEVQSPVDDEIFTGYKDAQYCSSKVPIIIDNGSYQCRAGFSIDSNPRLIFRSLVGKLTAKSPAIVGNSLKESDNKLIIKSPFDSNILVHPPSQESIFDYIFYRLGIDRAIENPLLITEPTSNPSYCRKYMTELVFECYNAPSVAYGIDSLFSFYSNRNQFENKGENALVIGSGHMTTHIYNVQNHKIHHNLTKRINVGGGIESDYLKRSLFLKYPKHRSFFTPNYINQLKEEHCYQSKESYSQELKDYLSDENNKKIDIIQLPFQEVDWVKLEEDKQRKLEQRKKLGEKLKEKAEQKRKDKKSELEDKLQSLETIWQLKTSGLQEEFEQTLKSEGIPSEKDLTRQMSELKEKLSGKKKEVIEKTEQEEYPLLLVPDSELNQEQLAEKKKQKVQKSMKDGKMVAKRKREEEKEKEVQQAKQEEDAYIKDPEVYINSLLEKRKKVLEKREIRLKTKTKVVRRDAGLRTLTTKGDEELDQQEEEFENAQLANLEKLLNKFEPSWNLTYGNGMDVDVVEGEYETAQDYQLRLGVERIKVPEILYQPKAIIGLDQMGLMETIQLVISQIQSLQGVKMRDQICRNIFITGGNSNIKNFKERLHYEITQICQPDTHINIVKQLNSSLDAWLGARQWALDNQSHWASVSVSKAEYQEKGFDYLKSHFASNISKF
ncbi:actin related protein 5 [Tieghemostelium lacteum]|uniref:Actin related protein 5 n=1 Tax=Tieghemostelium lacteum TaxID=361077 RepID=A0A151ZDX9_TIELA|nr:actin related protein 5 [Tieghemostelium lacteum]|eukprot:KYQ92147.1 actin related protein 5 [Tieghemostelium lacteum]